MGRSTAGTRSGIRSQAAAAIALVALSAVLLAACGGGDDSSSAKSTTTKAPVTTTIATTTSTTAPPTTAAPTTAPPTTAPPTTAAGCRDAVCAVVLWLSNEGHGYAGDCASTTPDQIPKWCSILHTDGATQKVFYVGPVFSEIVKFLTVTEGGGNWTVTNVENAPQPGGG